MDILFKFKKAQEILHMNLTTVHEWSVCKIGYIVSE